MKVFNRQKDSLTSSITPHELGRAMSSLDLASIPPEKRHGAVMDRLASIMADTIHDRAKATEIMASHAIAQKKRR